MKKKLLHKISIILSLLLSIIIITNPISAWFVLNNSIDLNIDSASILNYFASGDGTIANPFIISHKRHIYHLSWLQDLGMLQDQKYYFEINSDINMEGLAIPPIGTQAYPFIGDLNGNNHIISNLFISNNFNELKYHFNISQVDLGSEVGFFGRVDSKDTPYQISTAGEAYNFYLENTNVSNSVNSSVIGIVAGHNNGALYNIGVSNNSFKLANGIESRSDYTLIGETGENTIWLDCPSCYGNKILIDPNDPDDLFTTLQPINYVQQYRAIAGSVPEHAYMTSTLDFTTSNAPSLYKITSNDVTVSNDITTLTPTAKTQITSLNDATANNIPTEFWDRYVASASNSSTRYIVPVNNPSISQTMAVPFENSTLDIPYNGVWFKPKGSGTCGIVFSITNQSDDSAMAIYEYQRDANGNIINWNQTRFLLEKNQYQNKTIVYFDIDVVKDNEYIIGKSTLSPNTAGFFYLILVSGYEGGGTQNDSSTSRIDYVMRDINNQFPDLSDINYTMTCTYLSFDGISSSDGYMYYNKTTYNAVTAVYYYSLVNSITIVENAFEFESAEATTSNFDYVFNDWMSQYLNSS